MDKQTMTPFSGSRLRSAPVVSNVLVSSAPKDPLRFLLQITRDYGDVLQFPTAYGPVYLVNHPDYIRDVLHGSTYVRVSMLKMGLGEGLLTSEGSYWRSQRRLMQPAFHQQCVESLDALITGVTVDLVQGWRRFSESGQTFDVAAELTRLTLRIIGKALLGVDFASKTDTIGEAISTTLECLSHFWFLAPSNTIPPSQNRRFQEAQRTIDEVVYGLMEDRRRKGEKRHDLLALLLGEENGEGSPLSDRQIRDEVVTMFVAGHETTANMLAWTWYLLSQHPEVEYRLHSELDRVLSGRVSANRDLANLSYTKMVIQESMRIYPPVLLLYRKSLVNQEVGGFRIPANAIVAVSPYTAHHDPRLWEEPDRFDPDRFAPERNTERPYYAYFPFGGGAHLCIGNSLATMEGMLILATIAQNYSLRLEPGHPVEPQPFMTLRLRYGLRMTLELAQP